MARNPAKKEVEKETEMIFIPPTPGVDPKYDYKDVCINGRITRVKKGVQVEVPANVAERLRHSLDIVVNVPKLIRQMESGKGAEVK